MSGLARDSALSLPQRGPVVLIAPVGAATGSRAAAAALACAASEPDRAALLIDLGGGAPPRPTLIATAGARRLEERVLAHLPGAAVASRGRICQLRLPPERGAIEALAAALPLSRESAALVHLPPALLRAVLGEVRIRPTGALLRADLCSDRALTALTARDLISVGLRVAVLELPLGWIAARSVLLGMHPGPGRTLPHRLCERLLSRPD